MRKSKSASRIAKLDEDLQEKLSGDFWTKSAMTRIPASSFGLSPKGKQRVNYDDGYELARQSKDWLNIDRYNVTHGRVSIETMLGKLQDNPGAGEYTPKIDYCTKRETIAPLISFMGKPEDHFLEELEDLRKTRHEISLLEKPEITPDKTSKKKKDRFRIKPLDLANVNIEDMRKALLPGPGTYKCDNFSKIEKFQRPPSAKLKPRVRAAIPRSVILPETMQILRSPSEKQAAVHYNIDKDPRKVNRSFTIGETLPPTFKRDMNDCTGPGYYNLEKVMATGETKILSSKDRLKHKAVPSFDVFRRYMNKSQHALSKTDLSLDF